MGESTLKWFGHVERMEEERETKRIYRVEDEITKHVGQRGLISGGVTV